MWINSKRKVKELEKRRKELLRRVHQTLKLRNKVIKKAKKIVAKYNSGKISKERYIEKINKEFEGKSPEFWVNYYDQYLEDCYDRIKFCEEERKREKRNSLAKKTTAAGVIALLLIVPFFIFFSVPEEIFLAPPSETQTFSEIVGITSNGSFQYNLNVESTGTLQSIKASGSLDITSGEINIYIEDDVGNSFLILNITENNFTNFSETCLETCNLISENLNNSSYVIKVKIIGDAEIALDELIYNIGPFPKETGRPERNVTELPTEPPSETHPEQIKKIEKNIEKGKRVVVSGPDNTRNVPVSVSIPESWNIKNSRDIRIYWQEDLTYVNFDILDSNRNGIFDTLEWTVSHLSNQTFDIIVITNALHLNSSRDFVSNIYEEVKTLDGIFSETIPNGDFVRVTFEKNLTPNNDITIFPKIVSGDPIIEVYETGENILITEFTDMVSNQYNKVFLNNLISDSQGVFDLRILNGEIEIDHIIDPNLNVRPNADGSNIAWACTGGSCGSGHFSVVNEPVTEPTVPDTLDNYISTTRNNDKEVFQTSSLSDVDTSSTSIDVQLWIYAETGNKKGIEYQICDAEQGGSRDCTTPNSLGSNQPAGWYSTTTETVNCAVWGHANCQELVDNLLIDLNQRQTTGGAGGTAFVYATYINLTYSQVSNLPPVIVDVQPVPNVDLIPAGTKSVLFNFTVEDPNGVSDIDNNSGLGILNRTGEPIRLGTCTLTETTSVNKTYQCGISLEYYDQAGQWDINVSISDLSGETSEDTTSSLIINLLRDISLSPSVINFPKVVPGGTNIVSSVDTTVTNNGNFEVPLDSSLQLTSKALVGETTPSENIQGGNFRAASSSEAGTVCNTGGITLMENTAVTIPNIALTRGVSGNTETLRYCLTTVPTGLSSQFYSATGLGGWEIAVLSVPLIVSGRKKKRKKKLKKREILGDEEFLKIIEEDLEGLLEFVKENKLKSTLKDGKIPINIFKSVLSPAEAVCKYLKENKNMSFSEVGRILNRNERTIWINYGNALKKKKEKLSDKDSLIFVPINIISNRNLSTLESIVKYLKDNGLDNSSISKIIGKSQNNIWTISKRVEDKLNKG